MQFDFTDAKKKAEGLPECVEKKILINVLEKLAEKWPAELQQILHPYKYDGLLDQSIALINEAQNMSNTPGTLRNKDLIDFQLRLDAHLKQLKRYRPSVKLWGYFSD